MAGLIPQSFIDDLLDRLDIVEVVDHRVKLKKTGKNYSACCPFHDEKTPSFTVSPDKQFYHCFGCGASGNALGFIMEYDRLGFPEAVETLARQAGLEVPREARNPASQERDQRKQQIYQLLEEADAFYQAQLRQHPQKLSAINYLKGRGLSGQIAQEFGIGFAPPGWDNLLQALGTNDKARQRLTEGGMLIQREAEHKLYDRFRHRIMFPIRDTRGRVIGFGGRVLGDDKPKYLNSPETPVFHKGHELYGLYEARQAYRELPRLLVVEGYMDVVALAQFGIKYGVATLGTACGEQHLKRAFRYTSEVVFCFDGDNAGRTAARRALENTLPAMEDGRQVKFLFLEEGEDPDSLVRQIGAEKFNAKIDMAVPLEDFLFDTISENLDIRTMGGRAQLSKLAAPLLAKLPKGVYRELMFDNLAARTGLSRDTLQELMQAPLPEPTKPTTSEQAAHKPPAPKAATPKVPAPKTPTPQSPTSRPAAPPATEPSAPPSWEPGPAEPHEYGDAPADYYAEHYVDSHPGHHAMAADHPEPAASAPAEQPTSGRYRMPPNRKVIALLLSQPALAAEVTDLALWESQENPELQLFARLLKILQQRPHYKLHQLFGYWKAAHGEQETQQLADIAGIDLLQATKAMTQGDAEDSARYDLRTSFLDTLEKLKRQLQAEKSAQSLEKLKNTDFTQLSAEERRQLVAEALANKQTRH